MLDQTLLLEKTTQVLMGTHDFQKLAQQAADLIVKELKDKHVISAGIFRVRPEQNEIYAYAYSTKYRQVIDALLPKSFSQIHAPWPVPQISYNFSEL